MRQPGEIASVLLKGSMEGARSSVATSEKAQEYVKKKLAGC